MDLDQLLEKAWMDHCYGDFPRRIGFPASYVCESSELFLSEVWRNVGYLDIYVCVYSEEMREKKMIDKIYIDLDCKHEADKPFTDDIRYSKIQEVHAIAKIIIDSIKSTFDYTPRIYFSGNKGFAIYIDLEEPYQIKHNFSFLGKRFIQKLLVAAGLRKDCLLEKFDDFDYGFCDPSVLGQHTRMSRLPFTKNIKSGLLCYPTSIDIDSKRILKNAVSATPRVYEREYINQDFNYLLESIDDEYPFYKELVQDKWNHKDAPPLEDDIESFIQLAPYITDGHRRIIHAMIIPRLVVLGRSNFQIREYCKQFIEASGMIFSYEWESYVQYQSDYRRTRGTTPWSWGAFFSHFPDLMKVFKYAEVQVK